MIVYGANADAAKNRKSRFHRQTLQQRDKLYKAANQKSGECSVVSTSSFSITGSGLLMFSIGLGVLGERLFAA
ncbi:MAG TPA: hypothetical protein VEY71_02735 [Chitinophagales bacterium]|nr:hypothetical protein [Chitinophagales bacterium]